MSFLVGNCDERFKSVSREWCIDFLPYAPDETVESVIGYKNPNRGYGYGTWAEFYVTESEARARFQYLKTCGAVERANLLRGPRGTTIEQWSDEP